MEFKNISSEEDFRNGQLRLEVTWDVGDVERFSDFFGRPMAEVVEQISEPASEPASTDVHTCDGYPFSDANRNCQACANDVMISANELRRRLEVEYDNESRIGEAEAACAIRGALMIVNELAGANPVDHPKLFGDDDG